MVFDCVFCGMFLGVYEVVIGCSVVVFGLGVVFVVVFCGCFSCSEECGEGCCLVGF